jgi:hypothetical protein
MKVWWKRKRHLDVLVEGGSEVAEGLALVRLERGGLARAHHPALLRLWPPEHHARGRVAHRHAHQAPPALDTLPCAPLVFHLSLFLFSYQCGDIFTATSSHIATFTAQDHTTSPCGGTRPQRGSSPRVDKVGPSRWAWIARLRWRSEISMGWAFLLFYDKSISKSIPSRSSTNSIS